MASVTLLMARSRPQLTLLTKVPPSLRAPSMMPRLSLAMLRLMP